MQGSVESKQAEIYKAEYASKFSPAAERESRKVEEIDWVNISTVLPFLYSITYYFSVATVVYDILEMYFQPCLILLLIFLD